jgi:hypothetical protein
MALAEEHQLNFTTLRRAFLRGDAALMECQLADGGRTVPVLGAINRLPDGQYEFVPFGTLFDRNPYRILNPPNPGSEFFSLDKV